MVDFYSHLLERLDSSSLTPRIGKIVQFYGLVAESIGPDVFLGETCHIYPASDRVPVLAEVVGFRDGKVLLLPYGNIEGVQVGGRVLATGQHPQVKVPVEMLGKVMDGYGSVLSDIGSDTLPLMDLPISPPPLNPLKRSAIDTCFNTGIKSIDGFLTMGVGQRVGLFAGSGVGKSSLLGMIAKHSEADVNVIALIGERGREVLDFLQHSLGEGGLRKSVVIVATSDSHPLLRVRAAYVATAVAEYFRAMGKHVLLAMDSLTRFAMAQREIGLALGEPPTVKGYTPTAFSSLPFLVERAGKLETGGAITAIYTVLVEGDDLNDPVVDHARAILDGHIVLSRKLANSGNFPAIDILQSISRLRNVIAPSSELETVTRLQSMYAKYLSSKDMIEMGVYQSGNNQEVDQSIKAYELISAFLKQGMNDYHARAESMSMLRNIEESLC